jgi:hypothetical protein
VGFDHDLGMERKGNFGSGHMFLWFVSPIITLRSILRKMTWPLRVPHGDQDSAHSSWQ